MDCAPPAGEFSRRIEGSVISGLGLLKLPPRIPLGASTRAPNAIVKPLDDIIKGLNVQPYLETRPEVYILSAPKWRSGTVLLSQTLSLGP